MKLLVATFLLFSSHLALGQSHSSNANIATLFEEAEMRGTFVLFDLQEDAYIIHNKERAKQRFLPASTFKIPNSLIGLTVKAIRDVDEVMPYGGKPQRIKRWEKDMPLREAITVSNVPVYQELARRIGLKRMEVNVRKLNYGNCEIGETVDTFWLEGPLEISALEQTRFLSRLVRSELPFPKDAQSSVREIIKLEETETSTLYGKTGWDGEIGWWVGWVNRGDATFVFALNIDLTEMEKASQRVELGKASLRMLGILD